MFNLFVNDLAVSIKTADKGITVNPSKSNVVHFRPNSVNRTSFTFTCGVHSLNVVDKYLTFDFQL